MSTFQVPGYVASNADTLHVGCWAEHADGSLMGITKITSDRLSYYVRSPSGDVYQGELPPEAFKQAFSDGRGAFRWLWHDKTPFPANPITDEQADRFVSAAEMLAQEFSLKERDGVEA